MFGLTYNVKRPYADLNEGFNYTPGYEKGWPPVERFEPLAKEFYAASLDLAFRFCDALSLGLDLPIDFMRNAHKLAGKHGGNQTDIRTAYYPAIQDDTAIKPEQVRVGEHIDVSTVTFDFQDNLGGLEIQNSQGEFVQADPIPGTVLVNVGPMLQRLTSDRLVATVHRMLVPEDERRYKARQALLLFLNADDDYVVKCIDGSDTYEPIKWSDYIDNRLKGLYTPS